MLDTRFVLQAAMRLSKAQAFWTCCALLLALSVSNSHAARPSPTQPAAHLPVDPNKVRSNAKQVPDTAYL